LIKKPERIYNKMADTRNKKRQNKTNGWADYREASAMLGETPKLTTCRNIPEKPASACYN